MVFHVVGSVNQVHVIHTWFSYILFHIWSQWIIYIMALRSVKTTHATTNMAMCIPAEISAYCNTYLVQC